MPGTAIVTDSTCGLPPELMEEHGITSVSLYVSFPDGTVSRDVDLDVAEFYERRLSEEEEVPTTSAPHVEDFMAAYEPLLAAGNHVVSVHLPSGISETCNVARQAVARLVDEGKGGERVEVVDAACAGGAMGLLVLAAAAGAAAGEDSPAIVQRVRSARQTAKNWFTLDTLEFLRRGGRIGGAAAWLGSRLQIKPILTSESEIRAVERVRTKERAVERLVDFAHRLHAAGADAWVVQRTPGDETADLLVDRVQKVFRRPPIFVSEFSPVLGTHTGPGLLFLAGMDPVWLKPAGIASPAAGLSGAKP